MSDTELSSPPPASVKGAVASEGDWTCADCGNINFAWRNACNRCAKARTPTFQRKKKLGQEIGKQAAEKSRGLFSADDWQCNKCGNVNWARRQQCNVCNAPKFGEVEERTGFGGGYNDRGVVEYKEREDSDDEYDEFGRRKRRRERDEYDNRHRDTERVRSGREPTREASAAKRPVGGNAPEPEEDDDEEEDDDDDGDLSKYDLSDWGDAAPARSVDARSSHRTRRSRTKSRSRSRSPITKSNNRL